MPEKRVSTEDVERYKRWAMIRFRALLRGNRVTEQIQRWLAGELGPEYRFSIEFTFNDDAVSFVGNPSNADALSQEKLT
jgi:hypothetical protein